MDRPTFLSLWTITGASVGLFLYSYMTGGNLPHIINAIGFPLGGVVGGYCGLRFAKSLYPE